MWKEISHWLGYTSVCVSHDSTLIVRFTARNDKQAVRSNESDTMCKSATAAINCNWNKTAEWKKPLHHLLCSLRWNVITFSGVEVQMWKIAPVNVKTDFNYYRWRQLAQTQYHSNGSIFFLSIIQTFISHLQNMKYMKNRWCSKLHCPQGSVWSQYLLH